MCFNGAATFQLRIEESMRHTKRRIPKLQWSRNFSVADCKSSTVRLYGLIIASMEPQLFSCGLPKAANTSKLIDKASMEPQLFSCGLLVTTDKDQQFESASMEPQLFSCGLINNQWKMYSLVRASMEPQLFSCGLPMSKAGVKASSMLQWSRNFSVADCCLQPSRHCPSKSASMEPQLFSCGLQD